LGWDYSTFDWDEDLAFERRVQRAEVALGQGGVVLMHSWPARTPELLARLLDSAGPGTVVPLDQVALVGRQPTGRTMHLSRTDPPR
jgi:predicted O-methyltransferase YrrM